MIEYYKSRYKKKAIKEYWHKILIHYLKHIANSKFSNLLHFFDKYELQSKSNKTDSYNGYFLEHSEKNLELREIEFIEVVELDNIDVVEKHIYRIIRKNKFFTLFNQEQKLSQSEINKIKKNLESFRTSFNSWASGPLFSIMNDKKDDNNNLYENVSFSYFKTQDNLLIFKIKIKPSKLFFEFLSKINTNKTIPTNRPIISHFKDFIRTKRIIHGHGVYGNLKEKGFNDLIYDLNYQIKKTFLNGFKGVFSGFNITNPYITYFNSKEKLCYDDFKKGFGIFETNHSSNIFFNYPKGYYLFKANRITRGMHIIGENNAFPSEYDKDKDNNKYFSFYKLFISWSLYSYLNIEHSKLNTFRKKIYSFINSKNSIHFRKQIIIKSQLSQKKIRFKRMKREFSDIRIKRYADYENKLDEFRAINSDCSSSHRNYYHFISSEINKYIKNYNQQINELDEYFKEISSINLMKLNYKFQIIAIFLAILGILFTLINIKEISNFFIE